MKSINKIVKAERHIRRLPCEGTNFRTVTQLPMSYSA